MHLSAICFNLNKCKILSFGNGLKYRKGPDNHQCCIFMSITLSVIGFYYRILSWYYNLLSLYSIDTHFMHQQQTAFKNITGKEENLLVMNNFSFSHNVFNSITKLHLYLSKFLPSYLYLLLNWKSVKLVCEVKGYS